MTQQHDNQPEYVPHRPEFDYEERHLEGSLAP